MNAANENTTMICLFHSREQAEAAVQDLKQAGLSKDSIGVMGSSESASNPTAMKQWKVPDRDAQLLEQGIKDGGVVVAVSTGAATADKVEAIFGRHEASQIDEAVARPATGTVAGASVAGAGKIDIVEEELVVGKRAVERGGVRIYQRLVSKPVTETVTLREEHVKVERRPVDRAVNTVDASAFQERSFEVTEQGEEAVVSKTARIVEEVVIGKETSQRTETVKDTVRKTDVTVEQIEPDTTVKKPGKR